MKAKASAGFVLKPRPKQLAGELLRDKIK